MATIKSALTDAKARLSVSSTTDGLDAQVLLCEVLNVNRAYLLAHPERELTPSETARYEAFISRREQGEPVAYILGYRGFYDREFKVTPDVLIPRPETELLLEGALAFAQGHQITTAVDVGTGSGALVVTFAALVPSIEVHAVDVSAGALAVAQDNAAVHGVEITFWQGDLLTPLIENGVKVDLIMANLPYIASDEVPTLEVSRYEPTLALDGGADGLALIRRLLAQAPQVMRPGGLMLLEIGADQGTAMHELVPNATIVQDYAGFDRIVRVEL